MPPREPKKDVRIWPVLKAYSAASLRYPGLLIICLIGSIGLQAANVIAPLFLRGFIDTVSSGAHSPIVLRSLLVLLGFYGVALGGIWLGRRVRDITNMRIAAQVMTDLANEAFAKLMYHGHEFFISNFVGTLTRRVTRYSRSYEQVMDAVILNFVPTLLFAVGSIGVLYTRNHWLGIALGAWVIIFIIVQVFMTRWRHPLRVARAAEDSRMTGALSDAVGNHMAIALFAAETHERNSFSGIVNTWRIFTLRSWIADAWIQGVQGALAIAVEVGLLVAAVFLWDRGLITVGDFVLIQVYLIGLIDQVWNIGNTLRRLYDAFADASEMLDIIETPQEIQDISSAKPLVLTIGKIAFVNTSFFFTPDRRVLDNFSLTIQGGEKVALVGSSGAGKSTITRLLLRLHDVQEGTITIDGQEIKLVTQESLRSSIAFVPQEAVLFHRTLRENIRYGKQNATEEEIVRAAKQAHCHEFISALPLGYDTYVGERGVKLSGGERQRVAIARALLKNAPILVLDEATSSLDSESEALIQDALAKLMEGKTVIAIAHRLSTIMKMDRIIVMERGKVVLSGSHKELLSQGGNLYKKLWEIQAGGFINADE